MNAIKEKDECKVSAKARKEKIWKEIGKRLQILRENKNLTQDEMADICGVSRHTMLNYLSGNQKQDVGGLALLCETFNISLNWLILGRTPHHIIQEDNTDPMELFSRLYQSLDKRKDSLPEISSRMSAEIEQITADTPENFLLLLNSMKNNPSIRKRQLLELFFNLNQTI